MKKLAMAGLLLLGGCSVTDAELARIGRGLEGFSRGIGRDSAPSAQIPAIDPTRQGALSNQYVSGRNRLCFYNTPSGTVSITVDHSATCPPWINL